MIHSHMNECLKASQEQQYPEQFTIDGCEVETFFISTGLLINGTEMCVI